MIFNILRTNLPKKVNAIYQFTILLNMITRVTAAQLDNLIEVDDETDPSSINKIMCFLNQILESDDNFMQLLAEKLGDLDIYWEQPWYQQLNRISRRAELIEGQEEFKTNSITKEEHEIIDKNWRKLRKKYKLPDGLVCLARWRNRKKIKNRRSPEERARYFVAAYLARGLQRSTHQVYQHILAHYGPNRKGFYTKTENKILELCNLHAPSLIGNKLSAVLGREPRGIYKKMNELVDEPEKYKKLRWDLPLATKFFRRLLKYTGLELTELKQRRIEKNVWLQLEKDMNQYYGYLQHFWYCYLHVQLFIKHDVKIKKLRKKLFKKLKISPYKVWTDICWKEFASEFDDGFTPRFLYRICYVPARNYPGFLDAPLEDVAEYVLNKIRKRKRQKNKRLKTLIFNEDGKLQSIDYRNNT